MESCFSFIDDDGKQKRVYRRNHRVVWETFNGEIKNDLTVDHMNHIKEDNRLTNLQLLTRVENGTKRHKNWVKDIRHKYNVYVNNDLMFTGDRFEVCERFQLTISDINKTNQGKTTRRLENNNITLKKV